MNTIKTNEVLALLNCFIFEDGFSESKKGLTIFEITKYINAQCFLYDESLEHKTTIHEGIKRITKTKIDENYCQKLVDVLVKYDFLCCPCQLETGEICYDISVRLLPILSAKWHRKTVNLLYRLTPNN